VSRWIGRVRAASSSLGSNQPPMTRRTSRRVATLVGRSRRSGLGRMTNHGRSAHSVRVTLWFESAVSIPSTRTARAAHGCGVDRNGLGRIRTLADSLRSPATSRLAPLGVNAGLLRVRRAGKTGSTLDAIRDEQ
jgi:hypothetical protein